MTKGSQGHACTFWTCTGSRRISSTFGLLLRERVLFHLSNASGRLRCPVTGVPPQPNSPTDHCPEAPIQRLGAETQGVTLAHGGPIACHTKQVVAAAHAGICKALSERWPLFPDHSMSKTAVKVVVFHCWFAPIWSSFAFGLPRQARAGGREPVRRSYK